MRVDLNMERAAGEVPAGEVPAGELPAGELPAGELPAGELPAGELPAGEVPAGEVPAGEVPAGEVPAGEVPAGEVTAGEVTAGEVLVSVDRADCQGESVQSIEGAHFFWVCAESSVSQVIEVSKNELTRKQVAALVCGDTIDALNLTGGELQAKETLATKVCTAIGALDRNPLKSVAEEEVERRLKSVNISNDQANRLIGDTPVLLSVNEAIVINKLLNELSTDYEHHFMQKQDWEYWVSLIQSPDEMQCSSSLLSAVFKAPLTNDVNTASEQLGCGYGRVRGLTFDEEAGGALHCYDPLWDIIIDVALEMNPPQMPVINENRMDDGIQVCDLLGNLGEMVIDESAQTSLYYTVGGTWMNERMHFRAFDLLDDLNQNSQPTGFRPVRVRLR